VLHQLLKSYVSTLQRGVAIIGFLRMVVAAFKPKIFEEPQRKKSLPWRPKGRSRATGPATVKTRLNRFMANAATATYLREVFEFSWWIDVLSPHMLPRRCSRKWMSGARGIDG
jgi:hypothetical protein